MEHDMLLVAPQLACAPRAWIWAKHAYRRSAFLPSCARARVCAVHTREFRRRRCICVPACGRACQRASACLCECARLCARALASTDSFAR
eukprot:6193850-Pleurochrysis_carterae.AAC.1